MNNLFLYNIDKKSNFFRFSLIAYIVLNFLAIFQFYAIKLIGGKIIFFVSFFVFLSILVKSSYDYIYKGTNNGHYYIVIALFFCIINFIFFQFISLNSIGIISESVHENFNIMLIFLISYFILKDKDSNFHKNLVLLIFIILIIDMLLSINIMKENTYAIRLVAGARSVRSSLNLEQFMSAGLAGFDIVYSIVLLIPTLIYLILKHTWKIKSLFLFILILSFIYIYKSSLTIAILATILSIYVYILMSLKGKIKYLFILISIIVIGVFLSNSDISYNILIFLDNKIQNTSISEKIIDIANFIEFGDSSGSSLDRIRLYNNSIKAFLKSPIFGVFFINPTYILSEHSTILDILGGLGLVGFIPFIVTLYFSYKFSIRYIDNSPYKKCIKTVYIIYFFIATFNPQLGVCTLFTLLVTVPLIYNITTPR